MGLPTSRDATVSAGTSVPSALINNLQDHVIGLWAGDHGVRQKFSSALAAGQESGGAWTQASFGWEATANTGTAKKLWIPLELPVGSRITTCTVIGVQFSAGAGDGVICTLVTLDLASPAAAPVDKSAAYHFTGTVVAGVVNPTVAEVIDATHAWFMQVETEVNTGPLRQVYGVQVSYDHP